MRKAAAAEKLASLSAVKSAMLGIFGMVGLLISAVGPFKVPFAETLAKTYYRQAIVGLVVMVALVGGLITAVVKLFDPNQFKDQLVGWVHERTQRDLVLDGDLSVSYFPKLGLESGKASLSQRRSAREFASIDKARVTIAWLPLLRGRVHIDSAEIEGLRAQLVRLKDGSTNVDDLAHDVAAIESTPVDLDSLRLDALVAAVERRDRVAARQLNELQIELGRLADGLASPLNVSARVDAPGGRHRRAAATEGPAAVRRRGRPHRAGAHRRRARGQRLGIDNLALHLKGDVTALAARALAERRQRGGLVDAQVGPHRVQHRAGSARAEVERIRLSGISATIDASVAHPDRTTTLALKLPRFEWAERALRDTTAQGQLTLKRSDSQLRVQGSSPLALVLDGGPRIELAALEMTAQLSHPALAADATAQLKGRLDINLQQQSALAAWSGQFAGSDVKAEVAWPTTRVVPAGRSTPSWRGSIWTRCCPAAGSRAGRTTPRRSTWRRCTTPTCRAACAWANSRWPACKWARRRPASSSTARCWPSTRSRRRPTARNSKRRCASTRRQRCRASAPKAA